MAEGMGLHICKFGAMPRVTGKTTYSELKASALKAGRYSVYEADANDRAVMLFTRLDNDPEIITCPIEYPWTSVRKVG